MVNLSERQNYVGEPEQQQQQNCIYKQNVGENVVD